MWIYYDLLCVPRVPCTKTPEVLIHVWHNSLMTIICMCMCMSFSNSQRLRKSRHLWEFVFHENKNNFHFSFWHVKTQMIVNPCLKLLSEDYKELGWYLKKMERNEWKSMYKNHCRVIYMYITLLKYVLTSHEHGLSTPLKPYVTPADFCSTVHSNAISVL